MSFKSKTILITFIVTLCFVTLSSVVYACSPLFYVYSENSSFVKIIEFRDEFAAVSCLQEVIQDSMISESSSFVTVVADKTDITNDEPEMTNIGIEACVTVAESGSDPNFTNDIMQNELSIDTVDATEVSETTLTSAGNLNDVAEAIEHQ